MLEEAVRWYLIRTKTRKGCTRSAQIHRICLTRHANHAKNERYTQRFYIV